MEVILAVAIVILMIFLAAEGLYKINEYTPPEDIVAIRFADFLILYEKYPYFELRSNKVIIKGIPITFNFFSMIKYKSWLKKHRKEEVLKELFSTDEPTEAETINYDYYEKLFEELKEKYGVK